MNVSVVGSVSSSSCALTALINSGVEVTCCLGLDESRATAVSDYRSLRPIAADSNIPFSSFQKITDPSVMETIQRYPADLLWVIGLSQLVPQYIIDRYPSGAIGYHPTMLPEGRGRAPIAWTLLLGRRAAVNLFFLTDEADAGDIIIQREVPVLQDDYSTDLISRMNCVLEDAILEVAPRLISGSISGIAQDHNRASYYQRRTPADGLIKWGDTTDSIYRLIRAAGRPYPGAFSFLGGSRVTLWRASPVESFGHFTKPGVVADVIGGEVIVGTGDGCIAVTEFETEGSRSVIEPGQALDGC